MTSWGAAPGSTNTHDESHGIKPWFLFTSFKVSFDKRKDFGSMYKSRAWKKKREAILRRDGYRSQLAARYGRNVQGDTVHHMLPLEFFPEYAFANWNLITVTHDEHNRLHDRGTHRLTAEGMELARRAALKAGLDVGEVMRRLEAGNEKENERGDND